MAKAWKVLDYPERRENDYWLLTLYYNLCPLFPRKKWTPSCEAFGWRAQYAKNLIESSSYLWYGSPELERVWMHLVWLFRSHFGLEHPVCLDLEEVGRKQNGLRAIKRPRKSVLFSAPWKKFEERSSKGKRSYSKKSEFMKPNLTRTILKVPLAKMRRDLSE